MRTSKFTLIFLLLALGLTGCAATPLLDNSKKVKVIFDNEQLKDSCKNLGELVGSQGNMISYWFTPERDLLSGALNDLKNQTSQKGGNTLYFRQHIDANTSITLLAEAYFCNTSTKA